MTASEDRARRALNRLGKWRVLLTGWQLGTRPKGDPECDAVRDHREGTLLQRAELSALINLLVGQGVIDADHWNEQLASEALDLSEALSRRFPGVTATDEGLEMDGRAVDTMRGWKP